MSVSTNSDALFRIAVESSATGMIMVDEQGLIVLVNAQVERLFGYDRAELIGQSIEMLVPQRFRGGHAGFRVAFFGDPKTRPMGAGRDLYGLRRDGTEVPIEIGLNPLETPEGKFVLSSVVDISERKGAGEALRQSEERFRMMVSAVKDYAILMLDLQGHVVSWNAGAEQIKGYRAEEIIGKHYSVFYPVEERAVRHMIVKERRRPDGRSFDEMRVAHAASGAEMVTVAVRRVPLDRSSES